MFRPTPLSGDPLFPPIVTLGFGLLNDGGVLLDSPAAKFVTLSKYVVLSLRFFCDIDLLFNARVIPYVTTSCVSSGSVRVEVDGVSDWEEFMFEGGGDEDERVCKVEREGGAE